MGETICSYCGGAFVARRKLLPADVCDSCLETRLLSRPSDLSYHLESLTGPAALVGRDLTVLSYNDRLAKMFGKFNHELVGLRVGDALAGIGGIGDALKAIKEGWMNGTVLQSPITEGDFEAQRAIEFLKTGKLTLFYKIMDNPKIDPKNVNSCKSEF